MKPFFMLMLLLSCSMFCFSAGKPQAISKIKKETLKVVFRNNVSSPLPLMSHPLICIKGGDFYGGTEMVLVRTLPALKLVHVVFPKKIAVPENLKKPIILQGHFQGIKNKDIYTYKKPSDKYRYFVVSSWKYQEK